MEKNLIENSIKIILTDYTSDSYTNVNKALTSKEPILLEKMNYYLNLVALNHRKALVGKEFNSQGTQKLYRCISLKNFVETLQN